MPSSFAVSLRSALLRYTVVVQLCFFIFLGLARLCDLVHRLGDAALELEQGLQETNPCGHLGGADLRVNCEQPGRGLGRVRRVHLRAEHAGVRSAHAQHRHVRRLRLVQDLERLDTP